MGRIDGGLRRLCHDFFSFVSHYYDFFFFVSHHHGFFSFVTRHYDFFSFVTGHYDCFSFVIGVTIRIQLDFFGFDNLVELREFSLDGTL